MFCHNVVNTNKWLHTAVIGRDIRAVHSNAFLNCTKLDKLIVYGMETKLWNNARLPSGLTVYAPSGSQAEKDAQENGFKFIRLEET